MAKTTKIQIVTRLNDGIYQSLGGGERRVVAEYRYGPRNLVIAYDQLLREQAENKRLYGNIGAGHTWMQTTDGRRLATLLATHDPDDPHADRVDAIEKALLTDEAIAEMDRAIEAMHSEDA